MSKLETNQVDPATGTTLTLGTSGDTINIPAGVDANLGSTGSTITIPSGSTLVNSGTATGFGEINTPAFEVYLDPNQSIATATWTKITHNLESFDTNNAFASNKFTVPAGEAGKYFFYAAVQWAQDDRQHRTHGLYKNGAKVKNLSMNHGIADSSMQISGSCFLSLAESDYIEHYVYQDSGDPLNASGDVKVTYFGGFKVTT